MKPLAPVAPAPGFAPVQSSVSPVQAGAEPSAAPAPLLGSRAVTPAAAVKPTLPRLAPGTKWDISEIPPDPPPLKGLGIPGLHTARVGDFDKVDDLPAAPEKPAASDTWPRLETRAEPEVDRRA